MESHGKNPYGCLNKIQFFVEYFNNRLESAAVSVLRLPNGKTILSVLKNFNSDTEKIRLSTTFHKSQSPCQDFHKPIEFFADIALFFRDDDQ